MIAVPERIGTRAVLRIIVGFVLVGCGLIGLVVPIMPGWVFIIGGLALLSRHFHWARRMRRGARLARIQLTRRFRRRKLSVNQSA